MSVLRCVTLISMLLLVLVPSGKTSQCASPRDQCVLVQHCPYIYKAIKSGAASRNSTLNDFVWSRACHDSGQQPRVCCEPEHTNLRRPCRTVSSKKHFSELKGTCVAPEQCPPIARYLRRRRSNQELARNICYQDGKGKDYYCCPDAHVSEKEQEISIKKGDDRMLRVKNAFTSCQDPNGRAGFCVPVRHCDHIYNAFLDSRINDDHKLAKFVSASRCKSDATRGNSICCSIPKASSNDARFIQHPKAVKLGFKQCGQIPFIDRIMNGSAAGLGQNPWMANLLYRREKEIESLCSGSLIHPRYILTAAHCMKNSTKPFAVRLGEYDMKHDPDCNDAGCAAPTKEFGIDKLIPHENFKGRTADDDIALIRLDRDVALSNGEVYPICLPLTESLLMLKPAKLTVTGWGMTEHQKPSNVLLQAELQVVRRTSFCEGEATSCMRGEHSEGHCKGDSGGPLKTTVQIGRRYRNVLFGVVSGGSRYCNLNVRAPGVGVMVGYYINWILDQMEI